MADPIYIERTEELTSNPLFLKEELEEGIDLCRSIFKVASEKKIQQTYIEEALHYLSDMLEKLESRGKGILLFYPELCKNHEYLIHHSVNAALLALVYYIRLKKPSADTLSAALAALLHDIGHALSDPDLLNSPKVLTNEEKLPLTNHPHLGYEILKKLDLPEVVLQGVLFHHEKYDETGYPTMLPASRIPDIAKIVALVDLYDNISSDRPYSSGKSPGETLRIMLGLAGSAFSYDQVSRWIRVMWPVLCGKAFFYKEGMVVKTNLNELARVVRVFHDNSLKPDIEILVDSKNHLLQKPIIIKMANDPDRYLVKIYEEEQSKLIMEKLQEKLQQTAGSGFKIELITKPNEEKK